MADASERAAALVVRAWIEPGHHGAAGLRARITYITDVEVKRNETSVPAKTRTEILVAVETWLDAFVG